MLLQPNVKPNVTQIKINNFRCFGLLICPGRNVTHSDMNLLEKVCIYTTVHYIECYHSKGDIITFAILLVTCSGNNGECRQWTNIHHHGKLGSRTRGYSGVEY